MYLSRRAVCFFWVVSALVGTYELIFTDLKEVGIVTIYLCLVGLWREYSGRKTPDFEHIPDKQEYNVFN